MISMATSNLCLSWVLLCFLQWHANCHLSLFQLSPGLEINLCLLQKDQSVKTPTLTIPQKKIISHWI